MAEKFPNMAAVVGLRPRQLEDQLISTFWEVLRHRQQAFADSLAYHFQSLPELTVVMDEGDEPRIVEVEDTSQPIPPPAMVPPPQVGVAVGAFDADNLCVEVWEGVCDALLAMGDTSLGLASTCKSFGGWVQQRFYSTRGVFLRRTLLSKWVVKLLHGRVLNIAHRTIGEPHPSLHCCSLHPSNLWVFVCRRDTCPTHVGRG